MPGELGVSGGGFLVLFCFSVCACARMRLVFIYFVVFFFCLVFFLGGGKSKFNVNNSLDFQDTRAGKRIFLPFPVLWFYVTINLLIFCI